MQEARSKFDVETDPTNAINIEPVNGNLSPEGSASLKFRRNSPSAVMGRINCKVSYGKFDACFSEKKLFNFSITNFLTIDTPNYIQVASNVNDVGVLYGNSVL